MKQLQTLFTAIYLSFDKIYDTCASKLQLDINIYDFLVYKARI